jgi:hypothetical protein
LIRAGGEEDVEIRGNSDEEIGNWRGDAAKRQEASERKARAEWRRVERTGLAASG